MASPSAAQVAPSWAAAETFAAAELLMLQLEGGGSHGSDGSRRRFGVWEIHRPLVLNGWGGIAEVFLLLVRRLVVILCYSLDIVGVQLMVNC